MKTALLKSLEDAMQDWVLNECEHPDRPGKGLLHDDLHKQMARAASAVYDATFSAQKYAMEQGLNFEQVEEGEEGKEMVC